MISTAKQELSPCSQITDNCIGIEPITRSLDREPPVRIEQVRVVYDYEKEYRVLVARRPDETQLETWRRGVVLDDDYRTAPALVRVESLAGKGTWLRVIMREGKKRQIRETGSQIGLPVVKIIRVRVGTLLLGNLKPGEWRNLSEAEVSALKEPPALKGQPGKAKPKPGKARSGPTKAALKTQKSGESRGPGSASEKGKLR